MINERKLSARALELINASDADRIKHINKPFFLPYKQAQEILNEMEELLEVPKSNRTPNILIIGNSDNGKTEILKEFLIKHPAEERKDEDCAYCPVIYVQCPPGGSQPVFLEMILAKLNVAIKSNESSANKLLRLVDMLRQVNTKILIIDELNSLLDSGVKTQRHFLTTLKYISNEANISIVAAGSIEAEYALHSDPHLKSRFPLRHLPNWNEGNDFKQLLFNFEYILPLKLQSEIYNGEVSAKIFGLSGGLIGEVAKILRSASITAIQDKSERITLDTINKCAYVTRNKRAKTKS